MRHLSAEEYQSTFSAPMRDVTLSAEPVVDIWSDVDRIDDLPAGRTIGDVRYVYRGADALYDHVLIATDAENVFLCVVVDLTARSLHGYRLMDFAAEYGS